MDYTEILGIQAKRMASDLATLTGDPIFNDQRFITSLHQAFCIIRNDARSIVLGELMEGRGIVLGKPEDRQTINDYIECYARQQVIPVPNNGQK